MCHLLTELRPAVAKQTVMSLAKTALYAARPRVAYFLYAQRRNASSGSHGHDEHHSADAVLYPKEGMIRWHTPCPLF